MPLQSSNRVTRLHWKLFFPLVGLLWLVIGITICYFVIHERHRLSYNLGNRLVNVNKTVIDAYYRGADLQKTVDFIRLFTNRTTLDPLHLTVYDDSGHVIADNSRPTIRIHDDTGAMLPQFRDTWAGNDSTYLHDMNIDGAKYMVSSATSSDGSIHSFAALPYQGEVREFLSVDSMVWVVVIALGILSSVMAYLGSRAVCRNVYSLRDFAEMISSNNLPDDIESWRFSKYELGEVSKRLLLLYREKIKAEHEKTLHERQIGINVSHELNTPVAIIKGYLDTIVADPELPEPQKELFIQRAKDNADRLAGLVGALESVMRLQESGQPVECRAIDFHDLAMKLADDVAHNHVAGDMTFEVDVPSGCMVCANPTLLTNALLNLVRNAAQHSGGSRIFLRRVGDDNGYALFAFSDNGSGVDSEHLERLFDLFYRVDRGRARKKGGAGLGLPLVKRIFRAMGGDIAADGSAGCGLTFVFRLPRPQ